MLGTFRASGDDIGAARRFVEDHLVRFGLDDHRIDDAVLCTSELATNAVLHSDCDFEIEKTFLRCPSCLRRLKEPCNTCGRPLDPRWKICPYCEAEVPGARQDEEGAPRRRRRRTEATAYDAPQ